MEQSFYEHEIRHLLEKSAKDIFVDKYVPECLKCPICTEVFEGQVLQCQEGHSVCSKCFDKMTHCPVCREPYCHRLSGMEVRNRLIEDLVREMDMACMGQKYGCAFRGNLKELEDHVGVCSRFVIAEKLGEELQLDGELLSEDERGNRQGVGGEEGEGGGLVVLGSRKRLEENGRGWWWWVKNGTHFLLIVGFALLFCQNIDSIAKYFVLVFKNLRNFML